MTSLPRYSNRLRSSGVMPFGFAALLVATGYLGNAVFAPTPLDAPTLTWVLLYLAALALLWHGQLGGSALACQPKVSWRDPYRWLFAFYLGAFWAIAMTLLQWQGLENLPSQLLVWAAGGAIFGLVMAFGFDSVIQANPDHYDMDAAAANSPFRMAFLFAWPFVMVALGVGFYLFPPNSGGWDASYLFFCAILGGQVAQPFPRTMGGAWYSPRALLVPLVGSGCLIAGLLLV